MATFLDPRPDPPLPKTHHRIIKPCLDPSQVELAQRVVYMPVDATQPSKHLATLETRMNTKSSTTSTSQPTSTIKQEPLSVSPKQTLSSNSIKDFISSHQVIQDQMNYYYICKYLVPCLILVGSDIKANKQEYPVVDMAFPLLGTCESFPLVVPRKTDDYSPVTDLKETAHMIATYCVPPFLSEQFGTNKQGVLRGIIKACNRKNPQDLDLAIQEFNQTLYRIVQHDPVAWNDWASCTRGNPFEFVSHVLEQSYSRSVTPHADQLKVKGFSNNVYGEVKQKLVDEFIQNTGLKPGQVFLDMGSGIGNVVLQVAAQCLCDSWGIEIMEKTATMANDFCKEFQSRIKCYGRPCGKIVLKQGDFLDDPEIDQVIKTADVIFVNKQVYIFDASLNQQILHKFLDLKDEAKIISLRSFDKTDRKITARTSQSIGSILKGKQYFFGRDSVSWMSEGGKYFIHTVDRSSLQKWESHSTIQSTNSETQ